MGKEAKHLYDFGPFRLDAGERVLLRDGHPVALPPKDLETLILLVEKSGHIVEKEELLEKVWPGVFVEEGNLARHVSNLRQFLTDHSDGKQYIETIPKRGYRFIFPVHELEPGEGALVGPADLPRTVQADALPALASRPRRAVRIALVAGAVLALAGAGVYLGIRRARGPTTTASPAIMLAVLPVQNLTGDPGREYLTDGFTEELIAQLGSFDPRQLGVIARTSAMAYKHTEKTVGQIAGELRVDYVLESSLRAGPGEIRFTAQLIRTSDQIHLWAHSYERPMKDVIALQGELARTIAEEIRINLTPQQAARLSSHRPVDPEAYDAFVQGRYHWNERSAGEIRSAIAYFDKALARDPDFAPAYAGLADSFTLLTMMRDAPPREMMPRAKDALLRALAIDDTLVDAHTVLGEVREVFDWDWPGADKEFRRAIELDPNDSNARHQFAIHLAVMGNFPGAVAELELAQRLDPVSPVMFSSTGWIFLRGRMPDRAILECQKALDLDPKFARGHLCLGEAYEEKRDLEKAAQEFLAGRILAGMTPEAAAELRKAIQESGYAGYFRLRLKQLTEKAKKSYVSPYDLADFSLRLGDREQALRWLEAAYTERSPYLVFLHIEPRMDALRSDPQFQDMLRRIGLGGIRVEPMEARSLTEKTH